MPLRTDCARCHYAPAVILLKGKLYCARCALDQYPQHKNKPKPKPKP